MLFADVTFCLYGGEMLCDTTNTFTALVNQLRVIDPRVKFTFVCTVNPATHEAMARKSTEIDNSNSRILKKLDGWFSSFVSDKPLTKKINYFELKFVKNSSHIQGIFMGVTNSMQPTDFGMVDIKNTCAMYNAVGNNLSAGIVKSLSSGNTDHGDVIGIVVDRVYDYILFYKNKELIAIGNAKPSDYYELYAFCSIYFKGMGLEITEKYDYHDLKRPTTSELNLIR